MSLTRSLAGTHSNIGSGEAAIVPADEEHCFGRRNLARDTDFDSHDYMYPVYEIVYTYTIFYIYYFLHICM